jgi:DNA-binding Lrp family transcriptional regulator
MEGENKAWLLLKVAPGMEKEVLTKVSEMGFVQEASIVYGKYDMVVKAGVDNIESFDGNVVKPIREIDGVESTLTLVSSKV